MKIFSSASMLSNPFQRDRPQSFSSNHFRDAQHEGRITYERRGRMKKKKTRYVVLTKEHLLKFSDPKNAYEVSEKWLIDSTTNYFKDIPSAHVLIQLKCIVSIRHNTIEWVGKLKETLKELSSFNDDLGRAVAYDLGGIDSQSKKSFEGRTLYRVLFARSDSIINSKDTYFENAQLSLLAIGETRIHFITNGNVRTDGLLIIKKIIVDGLDDTVQLILQSPLEPAYSILISSVCSELIIAGIRQAIATLAPFYEIPIKGTAAAHVKQQELPATASVGCDESFKTLLKAYCDALLIDPNRIIITTTSQGNIDPAGLQITVCSPKNHIKDPYSVKELFAIFRSLRCNTSIIEISFKSVDLSNLEVVDNNIVDVQEDQNGMDVFLNGVTMLTSELYYLITTNNYLIKLDLTDCNIKANNVRLGALAAIGLAINTGKTKLEMLHLGGNVITKPDRLVIEQGIREREQAIKELDISSPPPQNRSQTDSENPMMRTECVFKMIQVLLDLDVVRDTLEYLNISNNELSSNVVTALAEFTALKTFKMANMKCTTAFDLTQISSNVLEELELSGTPLTPNTIDVLSSFIRESSSDCLKTLSIENCQVNSEAFDKLCSAISESQKLNIELNVGNNPLLKNFGVFINIFRQNKTPYYLSIDSISWEGRRLVSLFDELGHNTSLKSLSIAKPIFGDASGNAQMGDDTVAPMNDDVARAMSEFLTKNKTLEELNISGNGKNMYGHKLAIAFDGLEKNGNLKIIDVSGNNLGKTGIASFSRAISANMSLKEIFIDDNQIEEEGLNILLDAIISKNTSIIRCPHPSKDLRQLSRSILTRLQNSAFHIARMEAAITIAIGSTRANEKATLTEMRRLHKELQNLEVGIKTKLDELDRVLRAREERDKMWPD
ncbi:1363_t:CDS:2 [Paraglomus occultum]|uniref:1363_t:CDS:1 n=1 Tax=Paraglomus occultum TaxID=144539 RepID=A0A9N9G3R9_9GLOM|nr:1363_t:CDS:2 [Paraglomus occultum]